MQIEERRDGIHCRIAGRLSEEECSQIRQALPELGRVRVAEVSELGVVDATGLELLEELRQAGAELLGMSPYLSLRLGIRATSFRGPEIGPGSENSSKSKPHAAIRRQGEEE